MALFFFIQRNWKWGTGDHISPEDWDLFRSLFFELCEEDVNPRYRHPEAYREWHENYRPRLAEIKELVRSARVPDAQ